MRKEQKKKVRHDDDDDSDDHDDDDGDDDDDDGDDEPESFESGTQLRRLDSGRRQYEGKNMKMNRMRRKRTECEGK